MGVEPNIPEVVKAAIEKAAVTLRSSAREYAPTPVKADRIISDIIEHLAPAITTLIANVSRSQGKVMKKPSDSEIQAFQVGLQYAIQVVCRIHADHPDWDARAVSKMAVADLSIVKGNQIMAQDALTTRMPVNQEKKE